MKPNDRFEWAQVVEGPIKIMGRYLCLWAFALSSIIWLSVHVRPVNGEVLAGGRWIVPGAETVTEDRSVQRGMYGEQLNAGLMLRLGSWPPRALRDSDPMVNGPSCFLRRLPPPEWTRRARSQGQISMHCPLAHQGGRQLHSPPDPS